MLLTLAGTRAAFGGAPEDAALCAPKQTQVTFDSFQAVGRQLDAAGTWNAAPDTPGVFLEVKSDADVWGSFILLGASGQWSWSGLEVISSRMCGRHLMQVYAHPILQRGNAFVNCFATGAMKERVYTVDCSNKAAIDRCTWTCAPDAAGVATCDGSCTASAKGLATTFYAYWRVAGVALGDPEEPAAGPWQQALHCTAGQDVTMFVRGVTGSGAQSPPVHVVCGQQP